MSISSHILVPDNEIWIVPSNFHLHSESVTIEEIESDDDAPITWVYEETIYACTDDRCLKN